MRPQPRHIQVYTLGRLSIDGFSFERVAQFNLEWIFSNLDFGFQSLVGFWILIAGFRIPEAKNSPLINYQTTQIPLDLIEHFVKRLGLGDSFNVVHLSLSW